MSVPDEKLIAATPEDLEWTLTHALQFDGRKHFKSSSEYMAKSPPRIWRSACAKAASSS
jgi:hypothetical protein